MNRLKHYQKFISIVLVFLFVFQADCFLRAQTIDDFTKEIARVILSIKKGGDLFGARLRLERLIQMFDEREIESPELRGKSHLLLGVISEKEKKEEDSRNHYAKAKQLNIAAVEGLNLVEYSIYREVFNVIEKVSEQKKKKKFPWLLVAGGVTAAVIIYFLLLKPKTKYQLAVTVGEGVDGSPANGIYEHNKDDTVTYNFTLADGYKNLSVQLDGQEVSASGNITMNGNHVLNVSSEAVVVEFELEHTALLKINRGEQGRIGIKLSAQPVNTVTVTIERQSGTKIQVVENETFTFTRNNYDEYTYVVLQAANDAVTGEGASFIIHGEGIQIDDVNFFADVLVADQLSLVSNVDNLIIRENENGYLKIKLSSNPQSTVNVSTTIEGDEHLRIKSGAQISFDPTNYNIEQTVTIEAIADEDGDNGTATVTIAATNNDEILDLTIPVSELDSDSQNLQFQPTELEIQEGETGTIRVRLTIEPTTSLDVHFERYDGDGDIVINTDSPLNFDKNNWNQYQDVELKALEDDDAKSGSAQIRFHAEGVPDVLIDVTEDDNDSILIETNPEEVVVEEGGEQAFEVWLSHRPGTNVIISVVNNNTSSSFEVKKGYEFLTFTPGNYDQHQTVIIKANRDENTASDSSSFNLEASKDFIANKVVNIIETDNYEGLEPVVGISTPNEGQVVGGDITIIAVANDDIKMDRVEFYINNQLAGTDTEETYDFKWDTTTASHGENTIKALAFDTSGKSAKKEIIVKVDNTPAEITINQPVADEKISGTYAVTVSAEDFYGVKSIDFYFNDVLVEKKALDNEVNPTVIFNFNTTTYNNATYPLKIVVTDSVDNESEQEINVKIEN